VAVKEESLLTAVDVAISMEQSPPATSLKTQLVKKYPACYESRKLEEFVVFWVIAPCDVAVSENRAASSSGNVAIQSPHCYDNPRILSLSA
jgi:hypothetical protein